MNFLPKEIEKIIYSYKKQFEKYQIDINRINFMLNCSNITETIICNLDFSDVKKCILNNEFSKIRYKLNNNDFKDLDLINDKYNFEKYIVKEVYYSDLFKIIYIKLED